MGTFIKLQDQLVRLKEQSSQQVTTPAKAVNEAIEFCINNKLTKCELDYDGFLFDIEPTSDLREKLNDYYRARGGSLIEESVLPIQLVSNSVCKCINWHPSIKADMGKRARCSHCGKLRQTDC